MTRAALGLAVALLSACGTEADEAEGVFGVTEPDPALTVARAEREVSGSLALDDGSTVEFSSVELDDGQVQIVVELNGMVLTADYVEDAFKLDGFAKRTAEPTLIGDLDRAALIRLVAALEAELYPPITHVTSKDHYDALRGLTPAEERLFSTIDGMWTQWPTQRPLQYTMTADVPRAYSSWRRRTNDTNQLGWHDCWDCTYTDADCQEWKPLGREFNGSNHGNCGTSSYGSQFTSDCTDHDACVRTSKHGGHWIISLYCDDEFSWCVDDEVSAPSCNYDWRGSSLEKNCPSSWNGTSDGCDCFCQFQDADCSY